MTLRKKTLLIISLVLAVFSLILGLSASKVLLGGFSAVENRETEFNLSRTVNAVAMETDTLATFLEDWAVWDDTYLFVANANADYLKKNVTTSLFLSQQLHVMAFLDSKGKIVYGTLFDTDSKSFRPLPDSLNGHLKMGSALLSHQTADTTVRGILILSGVPLLIASHPIMDSERLYPPRGVMIVGRFLNDSTLGKISANAHLSLSLSPYAAPSLPPDFAAAAEVLSAEQPTWIHPINEEIMAGYALLRDIYGQPGLILRVDKPRLIYLQGKKTVQYYLLLLLAVGLLFAIANLFLLEKTILSRLSGLSRQVFNIGKTNSPSLRVHLSGQDELSLLAGSINTMLGSLEIAQNELKESDAATRVLLDGMPDSLLRINRQGIILDFKTARDRLTATPAKLLSGNSISEAYPEPLANKISEGLEQAFIRQSVQHFEHEMVVNNQIAHLEIRITPINGTEAIIILRDFTERKQMEKSLQFFNLRDSLTGLFNRTYWEEKLSTVSQLEDTQISIMLCEIDEMRLLQNTLGPEPCNNLLVSLAAALRASLPIEAVIARIGAEEFAILMIGISETELTTLDGRIRQEVERSNAEELHVRFGISLGAASGIPKKTGVPEIIKTAQLRLHKEKLSHSQSSRAHLFQSLQTALETRDFVTHQHATRLWALGRSLAKSAGLPARRLRDFKLLTQFHDIGKVGLSDELIFKQGRLTPDEMRQMKQHVEIGHRIAQSIPELFSIADLLLKHHEWWNGEGYPLGLHGEEIPLECRIFSIVDAFDAMTNDRPDRKALSVKEAAAELRRCAGSQFEPNLVKKFLLIIDEDSSLSPYGS